MQLETNSTPLFHKHLQRLLQQQKISRSKLAKTKTAQSLRFPQLRQLARNKRRISEIRTLNRFSSVITIASAVACCSANKHPLARHKLYEKHLQQT